MISSLDGETGFPYTVWADYTERSLRWVESGNREAAAQYATFEELGLDAEEASRLVNFLRGLQSDRMEQDRAETLFRRALSCAKPLRRYTVGRTIRKPGGMFSTPGVVGVLLVYETDEDAQANGEARRFPLPPAQEA